MLRKLLLVGAVQGWAFWGLWKTHELKVWPATDALSERALLYFAVAVPLVIYLTEGIASLTRQRRLFILGVIAILFPLLGAYSGWVDDISVRLSDFIPFARPSDALAAMVLGFVLIPLLAHFDSKARSWSYHELFETAWRNVILCISAAFLTATFWMVLFAGSELLHLIGLNFMRELIKESIFSIPVTGIAFGAAFALALARAEMVVTLRRFQLSMLAWLLPLLMMFILVWVIALPFTGVELLFKTHNAAFILTWCAALCISFVNAAYQDGQAAPPYGKFLSKLLAAVWLGLPVVVGVAWWAMWLRIAQHDWSEDRVWGMFVVLMATLYVTGYAVSALRRDGWLSSIGKTNMWSAVILCLGLLALISPIADARRIAVNSQMQRLANQTVANDKFDFAYLRWDAGKYGQDALHLLAAGITHPERDALASKAKQILAQAERYRPDTGVKALSVEELRQRFRALPTTATLNDAILKALQSESKNWAVQQCFNTQTQCAVWQIDLNADGASEAVVLIKNQWNDSGNALVMQQIGDQYRLIGNLSLDSKPFSKQLEQIERNEFKIVSPAWSEVEMLGQRLQLRLTPQPQLPE
ncbi:MAG: DUF4153 domain-containing protein [Gallionella sp.]